MNPRQIEPTMHDTEFISTSGRPKYEIFWHKFTGKKSVTFKTSNGKTVVLKPGDMFGAQEFSGTHDIISFPDNNYRVKMEIAKSDKLMERAVLKKNFKVVVKKPAATKPEPVKPTKPAKPTTKPTANNDAKLKELGAEYKQVVADLNKLTVAGTDRTNKKFLALEKRKASIIERATVLAPHEVEWYLPGATLKAKVVKPKKEVEKTKTDAKPKIVPAMQPEQKLVKPVENIPEKAKKIPKALAPVKPAKEVDTDDDAEQDTKYGPKIFEPLEEADWEDSMNVGADEIHWLMNSNAQYVQPPKQRKVPKV